MNINMWYKLAFMIFALYAKRTQSQESRDVLVHLFEWKWSDIEAECPNLASWGYYGVQVSPPHEHRVITNEFLYPWWQRYQPVSYNVTSRSGDEAAFRSMVQACNDVGISIFVDAVINHMTNDGSGIGSGGNFFDAGGEFGQNYPAVPYGEDDFNGRDRCFTESMNIESYQNATEVRNCRLNGLRDLRMDDAYVQGKVSEYLNKLLSWGVAGFRVDASKHMWPADLAELYATLQSPIIYQEVIETFGEPIFASDYTDLGLVTEFKYGRELSAIIYKYEGRKLSDLVDFGQGWGLLPENLAVTFIDNHDNQRGHGGGGDIVTHADPREYQIAVGFMLAYPYAQPRVMSSYTIYDRDHGPPSDSEGNTLDVDCDGPDWQCEHRWRAISNLVRFHNVVNGERVLNWWDNGADAIAFGREDKGFVAFNNEVSEDIEVALQTGLPQGDYCNVALCDSNLPPCVGDGSCSAVSVGADGVAQITIPAATSIVAIHV